MYLDSHVHFWKLKRGEYSWIAPRNRILFQDRLPWQLEPDLEAHGVAGVILVEAASTVDEIEYMLGLAEQYRWIKGVVGGLDLTQDSFEEHYRRLRMKEKFVGIRVNGAKFEHKSEQARKLLLDRLELLQRDRFPIDLLASADQLPAVLSCLSAAPRIKAVINHLGVPSMKEQAMEAWMNDMRSIEVLPHTMVKLSGMLTLAGGDRPEALRPYVQYLARTFQSGRLLFGSDWPVALQGGTYDEAIRLFEALLPAEWDETERHAVRCRNGYLFYGIEPEEAAESE